MVLIYSQLQEVTTNLVMDWLKYLGAKDVVRINGEDCLYDCKLRIGNDNLNLEFKFYNSSSRITRELKSDKIKGYWYRRGKLNINNTSLIEKTDQYSAVVKKINTHKSAEKTTIEDYLTISIENSIVNKIGSFYNNKANKPLMLEMAKASGLQIPNTLITSSKDELRSFITKYKNVVCKPLSMFLSPQIDDTSYQLYTKIINKDTFDKIPDQFSYSYFQEYIPKKYEIRTFYLKGKCYSMAIFSQANKRTEVDFRRYDWKNPNRNCTYKLPNAVEKAIDTFMKKIRHDTGSLDIIYSTENQYRFLEINPVGQLGMVSFPCNYQLEKLIAKHLINEE